MVTTRPPGEFSRALTASVSSTAVSTLRSTSLSQRSRSAARPLPWSARSRLPALLTRTSTRSGSELSACSTASGSVRSQTTGRTSSPRSAAALSSTSRRRPTMVTRSPAPAKRAAMARPIPVPPPETTTSRIRTDPPVLATLVGGFDLATLPGGSVLATIRGGPTEKLYRTGVAVDPDQIAGAQRVEGPAHPGHAGHAEFAGDDGGVAQRAAGDRHQRGRLGHQRHPLRVRVLGDQHRSGRPRLVVDVAQHHRPGGDGTPGRAGAAQRAVGHRRRRGRVRVQPAGHRPALQPDQAGVEDGELQVRLGAEDGLHGQAGPPDRLPAVTQLSFAGPAPAAGPLLPVRYGRAGDQLVAGAGDPLQPTGVDTPTDPHPGGAGRHERLQDHRDLRRGGAVVAAYPGAGAGGGHPG